MAYTPPMMDFFLAVAQGKYPEYSIKNKFGRNPDINGSEESIWNGGGYYTGHNATAAEIVEVFSSSVNDTSAGTGARTVTVYGLDASGLEQEETLTLNGTTPVDSTLTFLRSDTVRVRTAGSLGHNEGQITVRQKTTTANVFAVMPATFNRTAIGCYTIPANKRGYLYQYMVSFSGKTTAGSTVRFTKRELGGVFENLDIDGLQGAGNSSFIKYYTIPEDDLPPLTDIQVRADSDGAVSISTDFILLMKQT